MVILCVVTLTSWKECVSFFGLFMLLRTLVNRKVRVLRIEFTFKLIVDHSNIEYAFLSFSNVGYDFVSLLVHLVTFLEYS